MSVRVPKVSKGLLKEISLYFQNDLKGEVTALVTVTDVVMSPDMRNADVHIRMVGDDETIAVSKKSIENSRVDLQQRIAKNLSMKFCPKLHFRIGVAPKLDRVDKLLQSLQRRRKEF